MKRLFLFFCLLASVSAVFAQTQQGYVKTKGRIGSNGQVIAGVRLTGATVRLKGKDVVSQASGTFSFVVSNKKYTVLDIQKKDYRLYDREQLREYAYSSNPLILVLEKPDDRESDKLIAQQKINRTLRRQLQQREDELERLKEENKITQQEYQRLYNELYSDEKKNQELIESMAERYASMDFDQMDEDNRRIKVLILNGELQKADSIINSKGSLEDRIASYKAHKEANIREEKELAEREENLQKSIAVENLTLNEIAEDCMNKHEMYKLKCMFDSAAYYIQMRAELDTVNWDWQFETANYYQGQNDFVPSEKYHLRTLNLVKKAVKDNQQAYEPYLAMSYNDLAVLYYQTQRFTESEAILKQALAIYECLAQCNPQAYEPDLPRFYNNLALLYSATQRFTESEAMHQQALAIYERLAQSNPQAYESDLAMSYNNLASLYSDTQRFADSEAMHQLSLAIRERLAQSNPQAYEPALAMSYHNLANVYHRTQRFTESEEMYKQAIEIYERLAQSNPQAYEPALAMSYYNFALLYSNTQRFSESEAMYNQALEIYERLAQSNPQAYEPYLAGSYNNLAILYSDTQRFAESEAMYKQALAIRERLAQSNPQIYETQLMESYYWLGRTLLLEEKIHEAQEPFMNSLHLARKQIKAGTETSLYWESLYYLSLISANEKDYASAYTYNEELLPLMNAMYKEDTEGWKASCSSQMVSQSFYANLLGKFIEGEQYSLEAIKVDSTQHIAYTNLAAALLFQGKVEDAENLYRQYKAEFKESFLDDFAEYERLNVIPEERKKDVERIKAMLKE